jgi:hypothetical protein
MWKKLFSLLLINEWISWGNKSLDPEERQEGWQLAKRTGVRVAVALLSAVGLGGLGMYAFLVVSSQAISTTPVGISNTANTQMISVPVPQSPGPDFNTLGWCLDPNTKRTPLPIIGPDSVGQMTLSRGVERIYWAGGDLAEFSWTDSDGKDQGPVQVKMPDDAKKCFRGK